MAHALQILALGPLTNIAKRSSATVPSSETLAKFVLMGGAVKCPGNLQDGGVVFIPRQHCRMES